MRRTARFACSCLAGLLVAATAQAEFNLVADARPGTLIVSSKAGDFEALGPAPRLDVTELEEASEYTTMPGLRLGLGWSSQELFADLCGTAGYLLNERFRSPVFGVDAALLFRLRRNIALGPHLGYAWITDPEWTGDADLDMDSTSALLLGMQAVIGYDILFVFSADYLNADPVDVRAYNGWQTNKDSLDISGVILQFGIMGRF